MALAQRQDSWTPEQDELLVNTVLKHIREGSTQLAAFEEVAKQVSRTPAACGFHWNSVVRKQYKEAIEEAKKQKLNEVLVEKENKVEEPVAKQEKKVTKKKKSNNQPKVELSLEHLDQTIQYLTELKKQGDVATLLATNKELKEELKQAKSENKELKQENKKLEQALATTKEDYLSILKIVEKAKDLVNQ